jgi:hypothetical protein
MKKILLAAMVVSLFQTVYSAQDWATSSGSCFSKGDVNLSAGLSIIRIGAFITGDYAILDAVSVGGGIGYNFHQYNSMQTDHFVPLVVRGSFHPFNLKVLADKIPVRDKLDTYASIYSGWKFGWVTWDTPHHYLEDRDIDGFYFNANVGARYYFTPTLSGFAEIGGFSVFGFGLSLKL